MPRSFRPLLVVLACLVQLAWCAPRQARKPARQAYSEGLKYEEEGRVADAERAFTQALESDPDFGLAWLHRAKAFLAGGKHIEALSDINNALHTLTENGEAWKLRGDANLKLNNHYPAIEDYNRAELLKFTHPSLYAGRAVAYASLGRMTQALADYSMAIKMRPDDPETHLSRGRMLVYLKRYRDAIEDYDQAIKLRPGFGEAYFARGQGYFLMGNFQDAIRDLESGLRLKPGEPEAEQLLSKARNALAPPRPPVAETAQKPTPPIPAVFPPAPAAETAQKPAPSIPVASPAPPVLAPATSAPVYAVQVGAFGDRKRAEQLRARMKERCGSAAIVEKPGPRPLWRVLAGHESSRAKATTLAKSLRAEIPAAMVVLLTSERNAIGE
ncbi:MAG: tetratricopeptide repeat protein [Acidobacteriales bacterium]|nr:tetratricopeptide repeat protein [Terriglobales bacterium]